MKCNFVLRAGIFFKWGGGRIYLEIMSYVLMSSCLITYNFFPEVKICGGEEICNIIQPCYVGRLSYQLLTFLY